MCTGRIDLEFIFRAFLKGADGVFIGGCYPGECHYITHGNFSALSNVLISKRLLDLIGVNPERLRLDWMSASEGTRFAELITDFSVKMKETGTLGKAEGLDDKALQLKIKSVIKLVPYIKLVERERFRVPSRTVEAYNDFYNGNEADRIFRELISDKLAISQIISLLDEKPMPAGKISEVLGLSPSEVSKHLKSSAIQGLAKYDMKSKCYVSVNEGIEV